MEEMTQQSDFEQGNLGLSVTHPSYSYLEEISKWTKFLSILGFVLSGFMVLGGLSAMTIETNLFGSVADTIPMALIALYGVMYLVIGLFYLIPCMFLFKSSNAMKSALQTNDSFQLEESFKNHKSFFKFIGITTLVMLILYALGIIFFAIFAASFF